MMASIHNPPKLTCTYSGSTKVPENLVERMVLFQSILLDSELKHSISMNGSIFEQSPGGICVKVISGYHMHII